MKLRGLVLVLSGLTFSNSALAVTSTGKTSITFVENGWGGDGVVLYSSSNQNSSTGCSAGATTFWIVGSNPAFTMIYTQALVAYSAGRNVEILYNENTCDSTGRVTVTSVRLE